MKETLIGIFSITFQEKQQKIMIIKVLNRFLIIEVLYNFKWVDIRHYYFNWAVNFIRRALCTFIPSERLVSGMERKYDPRSVD